MSKAYSMAGGGAESAKADTVRAGRSVGARRGWSASQITLFLFVFCVFSLAGSPQLGFLEDLTGYLFLVTVVIESIRRGHVNFFIPVEFRFAGAFVLLLLFTLCIEGLFADSSLAWLKLDRFFNFFQVFILGLLITAVLIRYGDIRPLEFAMYGGVLYSSLLMFGDLVLGSSLARAGGGIGQPNELGIGLAMASTFAFSRLVLMSFDESQKNRLDIVITGALLGIQFLATYANFAWTGSRTGMVLCVMILTFSVGTLCYGASQGKPRLLILIIAVAIGLPTVLQTLTETSFVQRLYNVTLFFSGQELAIQEQSLSNRTSMAQTGLALWWEKPFFGWGFDSFRYVSGFGTYAHSNYIELLANNGVFGIAAYLSIFVAALLRTVSIARRTKHVFAWCMMLFLLVGVLLASGVTAVTYYKKAHWILLGFIVALIALAPKLDEAKRLITRNE